MKNTVLSWQNVRTGQNLINGTIEIFHEAFPGYPGDPEYWENRYYRATVQKVRWQEGLPNFFLRSIRKFDRLSQCWKRPRIKFGKPLKTYRKVREFSDDVQPQLCRNGVIVYEQPFGQCRIFPLGTTVPILPDYSYEHGLSELRMEIRKGKNGKFRFLFR